MEPGTLIVDDAAAGRFRVNRKAMTSHEIFAAEKVRIFDRCWLYVGHDSEVEAPGAYRRRIVAGRPLIFVRGADKVVRVLYNSCTHRGATVCTQDEGVAAAFTCMYHAWSFSNQGALLGVPDERGYGGCFDKSEHGLKAPPRVDSYRGMYFVNFDKEAPSLEEYLSSIRDLIDLSMDSAEFQGGWKILPGTAKYGINANWKLLVENSYDGYHLPSVHQTYIDYLTWRQKNAGVEKPNPTGSDAANSQTLTRTRAFAGTHGHGGAVHRADGRAIANPSPLWSEEVINEVLRVKNALMERFGVERGRQMTETSRQILIFPNLMFQDTQTGFRLRQIWPVAPGKLEVQQWDFVPREEREDLHDARMEYSLAFLGPGGLASPDDVEALESCQRGFAATEVQWSDISRGMSREPQMNDELQMRAFWRQWNAHMHGLAIGSTDDRGRSSRTTWVNLEGV